MDKDWIRGWLIAGVTLLGFAAGAGGTLYLVSATLANPFEAPAPLFEAEESPSGGPGGPVEDPVEVEGVGDVEVGDDEDPDTRAEAEAAADTVRLMEVEAARNPVLPADSADALIAELRERNLLVPVAGVPRSDLHDHFTAPRGQDRLHHAIDIMAPRNTPVRAVEAGSIEKLYLSNGGGGIAIYQFDPSRTFGYYYAHLERYAEGLEEGDPVQRGQVIGYIGTSGNAPPDAPHLHFAVTLLTPEKRWWEGTSLNPFRVLR